MHIALVNRWYPPESGYGGVAMYNHYLAHALVELGHKVTIVACRWTADVASLHRDGAVTVHRLLSVDNPRMRVIPGLGYYWRSISQVLYSRRVARRLRRIDRVAKIDVVECAEVNAEGFSYLRSKHRPVIVRCHTPTFVLKNYYERKRLTYDTGITSWCEKDTIRRANRLTAPSRDMARVIAEACGLLVECITVIPNALGLKEYRQVRNDADSGAKTDSEVRVLHVGRLDPAKGIEALVEAIPKVVGQAPNVRFVFVGDDRTTAEDGARRAALEKRLAHSGALGNVEFLGRVDQEKLVELYKQADICVVPSMMYESFSYTCAQGMAAGKPVVASRIGGIPETVQDGVSGIVVPPGDVSALAEAVLKLAGDPDLRYRMGCAGQARAEQEFDAIKVARATLDVYAQGMGLVE